LRDGTEIEGLARDAGGGRRVVVEITKASGLAPEEYRALPHFQDLTSVNPHEPFRLAAEQAETSLRIIDRIAPLEHGQRGLTVSPARPTARWAPAGAPCPAASTTAPCSSPASSSGPRATARTRAASPSWPPRSSRRAAAWTRSSSRSSRAPGTWS